MSYPSPLNFLIPGASQAQLEQVPTTDTEQPGMGQALGGVAGGALGASGGLMSTAVLSTLIPGIGPITAIGLAALGFVGLLGGTLAGVAVGSALEDAIRLWAERHRRRGTQMTNGGAT